MKKIKHKFMTAETLEGALDRSDVKISEYVQRLSRGALGSTQLRELYDRVYLRDFLEGQLEMHNKTAPKKAAPPKEKAPAPEVDETVS